MHKQPTNSKSSHYRMIPVVLAMTVLWFGLAVPVLASSVSMQTGDRVTGINAPEESPFVRLEDGTLVIQSQPRQQGQEQTQQPAFIYVAPEIRWSDNNRPGPRPRPPVGPPTRPVHPVQPVLPLQP